jgi:uncharacterized ferritin-like protein (DUF455 family)
VSPPATLSEAALRILGTPEPRDKVALTHEFAEAWRAGAITDIGVANLPARPARPARPELRLPKDMPRRRKGGAAGRLAFLHAIAHIECNAIDLAWDIVARFTHEGLPRAFYDDWVGVADDEARHFRMLDERMRELGGGYGDLPAHDGLWQAATDTADDLMARLALVPMVLEARGLDTTPAAVAKLTENGDRESAEILATIGAEEMPHVAAGVRWFRFLATRRGIDAPAAFHALVRERFMGQIKPPFNHAARAEAGMERAFYEPLTQAS